MVQGLLGPARVNERHQLIVAPSDATLSFHFSNHGARQAAGRAAWPLEDTVELKRLAQETKVKLATLLTRAEAGAGVAYDESGQRYVRRSEVVRACPTLVAKAIATLPPKARKIFVALDSARWFGPNQALRRTKATWEQIVAHAPTIEYRKGLCAAWLGDEILDGFALRALTRAVEADEHCCRRQLPVSEFHHLRDAVGAFEAFGIPAIHAWNARRYEGRLTFVKALHPIRGVLCHRPFVHIPSDVWESRNRRIIRRWFREVGRAPRPSPRVLEPELEENDQGAG
jgi:hypothetical protein